MHGWAVFGDGKELDEIELETPIPAGTQVLLEVTHCGVCHSDLYLQDGYYDLGGGRRMSLTERGIRLPHIPGHETVGRVVAFGPDAKGVAVGDHRVVFPYSGCGACARCLAGNDHLCHAPRSLGVFRNGGYGSHVMVDRPEHLVDFEGIDPALASTYACSGITAYSAVRKALPGGPGEPIVVVGVGGLGLASINILRALGFFNIVAVDIDANKRAAAIQAGAVAAIDGGSEQLAADIMKAAAAPVLGVVDFVASTATATASIQALAKGGTYVPVGLYGGELTLQLPTIPLRAISIRGSYTGSLRELKELIDLAKSGALRPMPVERVPRSHVNAALARVRLGEVTGRLVLADD